MLFGDGRISFDPSGKDELETEHSNVWFDLDYSYTQGSEVVNAAPGQNIRLEGQNFTGDGLELNIDLTRILLDVRVASTPRSGVSFQAFTGLEFTSADVYLNNESQPSPSYAENRFNSLGPAFGVAIVWQPVPVLRLSAEGRLGFGISSEVAGVELQAIEAGASIFFTEHISLFGGWRRLDYEIEPVGSSNSDLDFRLSGPVVALRIGI